MLENKRNVSYGAKKKKMLYSQGNIGRQREYTNFETVESSRVYTGSLVVFRHNVLVEQDLENNDGKETFLRVKRRILRLKRYF